MKKLVFMLLLSISAVAAQTPNRPLALNLPGYIGNPIEATINLAPSDTTKVITAKAFESDALYANLVSPQPTLTRTGLKLAIQFPASNLVRAFLEIRVGGLVRYSGWLSADKAPAASNPASLTALQYITLKGDKGDTGPAGPKGDPGNAASNLVQSVNGKTNVITLTATDVNAVPTGEFTTYKQNVALSESSQNQAIEGKLPASFSVAQGTIDANQNTQIAGKLSSSYSTTQALVDGGQNNQIDLKANSADVYPKNQTYSQVENDAKKPDFEIVSTFAVAQTKTQSGKPKVFILTNDAAYGGSSVVIWSGSSYSVLPAIPRTN